MSDVQLQNPLTTGVITLKSKDEAEVARYLDQGWLPVDDPSKAEKPKQGAPKPDIKAGREALGVTVTEAASPKSSAAKAADHQTRGDDTK